MDFALLKHKIFNIQHPSEFNEMAVLLFHYQYENNAIYRQFVDSMNVNIMDISHYHQIPFIPIQFFKTQKVVSGEFAAEAVFESSGTTQTVNSKHYIADISLYEESFSRCFKYFYGNISEYALFALLPSYMERCNSSLVYMVEKLSFKALKEVGGFYLDELAELQQALINARNKGLKIMLIGVTFALVEMAENYPLSVPDAIVIETGGMKGRGIEMIRSELHQLLCKGFGVDTIHSEYGMTELLSQAWSNGNGIFRTPTWMKILISDPNDPLSWLDAGVSGGINVIDLANIHSCSFIATQDIGRVYEDESFEVLGRFDSSDIRGCSLLAL